jgi:hypothetical protein
MMVGMRMTGSIGVTMLVFVKRDFEFPIERVRYPAQRFETGNMCAALQPTNRGLGHAKPFGGLRLGFACILAKSQQYPRTLCRDGIGIVPFARFPKSCHGGLSKNAKKT